MNLRRELVVVTTLLVLAAHIFYRLRFISWINASLSTLVAVLFLYGPTVVLWIRRRPIDFLDRGWRSHLRSTLIFSITSLLLFPPFFAAAHFWQTGIMGYEVFAPAGFPRFWTLTFFQVLMVALPEEFYFRGYFQSTIDRLLKKPWRLFGANLGWGWIITAAVFAAAHSVVTYRWWHFAIFFPGLVFGYLRARTGTITAPILFHAASNVLIDWFVRCYS